MTKQKIRFIANPISGANHPVDWAALIETHLDQTAFDYELTFTRARGDATNLAREAADKGIDIVCAIGGDGTINETAQGLIGSSTALAIIPRGSGNGLARHLGIPLVPKDAIGFLHHRIAKKMDVGYLNDQLFLCAAGIGFDAKVADAFDQFGKRGLFSYLYLAFKTYIQYKPATYELVVEDQSMTIKAFFVAFANASQYGNNAYIAPQANIADGMLDLVIIKPFPIWRSIAIIIKTFTRSLHRSSFVTTIPFKNLTLNSPGLLAHVDGEPLKTEGKIIVSIQPKALKIVY